MNNKHWINEYKKSKFKKENKIIVLLFQTIFRARDSDVYSFSLVNGTSSAYTFRGINK